MTILIATAALLSVPQMQPDFGDYPSSAIRAGHSAAALIEISVDPAGRPIACQTLEVFGDDTLGRSICNLQRSAKYEPALNELGEQSHGIVRALVKYVLIGSSNGMSINRLNVRGATFEIIGTAVRQGSRPPDVAQFNRDSGEPQIVAHPDVVFDVEGLPGGAVSIVAHVIVAVDKDGKLTECAADPNGNLPGSTSGYTDAACQNLRTITIDPFVIGENAVSYVRPLEVQFAVVPSD